MKNNQIILGVETTTNICSVALWDGEQLFEEVTEKARSHSKSLLPMVEAVLARAKVNISTVDSIACARGPGSFTGVRIGIGVAKGLAFGQDIPILPVSPLQAIAYRAIKEDGGEYITALMDARMSELYASHYRNSDGLPVLDGQEYLTNIDSIKVEQQLFAGTGMQEYRDELLSRQASLSTVIFPYASDIVELAQQLPISPVSAADFAPIYLRNKVTY